MDDGQVVFGDLPVADLLVEHPQGLGVLGGHDDAAGVPVDAVAQGGGEGVLVPGVPLLLLIEVGLDVGDQGVDLLVLIGVAEQAGPLVQQHQVFILVDDLQPGPEHREEGVVLPGLVEELVVDVQLEHIPLPQPHVPLGALAVHLHPLEADVLLGQGAGEQGEGLGQPAIQPLPGVVFSDGKLSH